MLDLFPGAQRDLADTLARDPARGLAPEIGEVFAATMEANRRTRDILAQRWNEGDFVQDRLDAFERRTGERIVNPFHSGAVGAERDLMIRSARERFAAAARDFRDPGLAFPSDEEIVRGGLDLARRAKRRVSDLEQRPGSWAATAGMIGGELASAATDPLNAIAIAATPSGGPLVMGALRAGLATAAQEAITQGLGYGYQQRVDPNHGIGDAAAAVGFAGVFGGLTEGGIRGIGAAWRRLRYRDPDVAASLPLDVRDAGTVVERGADIEANNPFRTGLAGSTAHSDAVARVEADLLAGRLPTLPESATREAGARTGTAFYPGGQVSVRYEIAELADLVTSHDADFRIRPDYPAELQPRDRAGVAARDQVGRIAADFQPERLGPSVEANAGAPIVGPDGIVESGNGRTLAIGQVYSEGGMRAADYRNMIERQGFDTSGFRQPVLVAVRTSDLSPEARAGFAHATSGSAALRMSATEQALSDARLISADLAALVKGQSIAAAANRDLARALVARLPEGERGGMLTRGGTLSAGGVRRVEAAFFARAFGDPDVLARALDHPDPNIKAIAGALTDAAPDWVRLRDAVTAGEIATGHDITDDVVVAVKAIMRARDEGRPVWEVMNQGDMFASDMASMAARLFFRDGDAMTKAAGRKAIADNLIAFATESRKNTTGGRLFADSVEPADVMRTVSRRGADMPAATASLLDAARQPEAIDKAAASPALVDAAMAEMNRLLEIDGFASRPIPIAEPDAAGGVRWRMGSLQEALGQVDAEMALAAGVRACASPAPLPRAA